MGAAHPPVASSPARTAATATATAAPPTSPSNARAENAAAGRGDFAEARRSKDIPWARKSAVTHPTPAKIANAASNPEEPAIPICRVWLQELHNAVDLRVRVVALRAKFATPRTANVARQKTVLAPPTRIAAPTTQLATAPMNASNKKKSNE